MDINEKNYSKHHYELKVIPFKVMFTNISSKFDFQ